MEFNHQPPQKDSMRVTTPMAIGAIELHDLLGCNYKTDGKGIHIPVGNNPQLERGEGYLG